MQKRKKDSKKGFRPPQDPENPTQEEFLLMVEAHDPTHVWSRSHADRERGEWERSVIDMVRDRVGDSFAVPAWNRAMHRKVVPAMVEEFLWKVRRDD